MKKQPLDTEQQKIEISNLNDNSLFAEQSIFERQKEDHFIQLHLAKDRLYVEAESLWKLGFGGSLLFGIVLIVAYFFQLNFLDDPLTIIAELVGVPLTYLLKKWSDDKRIQAARIQEQIDTELFDLPWNDQLAPENTVNPDVIPIAAAKSKVNPDRFKTWYTAKTAASASFFEQVLKCQRENISFDYLQRKKYARLLLGVGISLLLFILGYAIIANPLSRTLLSKIILPLLGFLGYVGSAWFDNKKTISEQEQMEIEIRKSLKVMAKNSNSIDKEDLRHFQDFLYKNRKGKSFVLNSFYQKHRQKHENSIQKVLKH